jgi:hypothetical protein
MKHKRQVGILLVLMLIASFVWLSNFRDKKVARADAGPSLQDDPVFNVDNPHIRMDEIARARKTEYKSSGRNPFSPVQAPLAPKPSQDKKPDLVGPQQPPPTAPPPPLTLPANVKCFGFGVVPNGTSRRAFFTDGEEVHVVAEGEVFLKRYRILRIGNVNLEFEEISTGRIGTAPIEEQPGGPS